MALPRRPTPSEQNGRPERFDDLIGLGGPPNSANNSTMKPTGEPISLPELPDITTQSSAPPVKPRYESEEARRQREAPEQWEKAAEAPRLKPESAPRVSVDSYDESELDRALGLHSEPDEIVPDEAALEVESESIQPEAAPEAAPASRGSTEKAYDESEELPAPTVSSATADLEEESDEDFGWIEELMESADAEASTSIPQLPEDEGSSVPTTDEGELERLLAQADTLTAETDSDESQEEDDWGFLDQEGVAEETTPVTTLARSSGFSMSGAISNSFTEPEEEPRLRPEATEEPDQIEDESESSLPELDFSRPAEASDELDELDDEGGWGSALDELAEDEGFSDAAAEEEESEDDWTIEEIEDEDFTPPSDPFASPEAFENLEEEEPDEELEVAPPLKKSSQAKSADEVTEEPKSSPKSKPAEARNKKSGLLDRVTDLFSAERFEKFMAQVKAELQGKDAPEATREEGGDEERDRRAEERRERKGSKRSGGGTGLRGILTLPKRLYLFVANLIFSILKFVLGILASLPLIGWPFKQALKFTRIIEKLAKFMPLVLLIAILGLVSFFSVPREYSITLPDAGGASFSSFSYDSGTDEAVGQLTNTGEVIAYGEPTMKLWSLQPTLNPTSWFLYQEVRSCTGQSATVDIDAVAEVRVSCGGEVPGLLPRVSGELR